MKSTQVISTTSAACFPRSWIGWMRSLMALTYCCKANPSESVFLFSLRTEFLSDSNLWWSDPKAIAAWRMAGSWWVAWSSNRFQKFVSKPDSCGMVQDRKNSKQLRSREVPEISTTISWSLHSPNLGSVKVGALLCSFPWLSGRYPSHVRPALTHFSQLGFDSSHLTRRVLKDLC
jgi:hypothetical protein